MVSFGRGTPESGEVSQTNTFSRVTPRVNMVIQTNSFDRGTPGVSVVVQIISFGGGHSLGTGVVGLINFFDRETPEIWAGWSDKQFWQEPRDLACSLRQTFIAEEL